MNIFENLKSGNLTANAKVDTYIKEARVRQGSSISGEVYVVGGKEEQKVKGTYIAVMTSIMVEENNVFSLQEVELQRVKVSEHFTIMPNEEKTIPFSFILSPETPMTVKRVEVWLKTTLDVSFECDPRDKNYIHVIGTEAAEKLLSAIQQMDFSIKKVINIKNRRTYSGVVQEFEFYPGSNLKKGLSELEMVILSNSVGTSAYFKLNQEETGRKNLLAHSIDSDEAKLLLHYGYNDVPTEEEIYIQLHDLLLS